MADSVRHQSQKKHHYSLPPILIFIFVFVLFLLILTILLLTNERSIPLLFSPSLYRDLFSRASPSPSPIQPDGVGTDAEFDGKKGENDGNLPVSSGVSADLDFGGGNGVNESGIVTVVEEFGRGASENGSRSIPSSGNFQKNENPVVVTAEFDGNMGENGTSLPISIGVSADLDLGGRNRVNDSEIVTFSEEFDGGVSENGSVSVPSSGNGGKIVSVQKNENGSMSIPNSGKKDCNLYMGKWVRDDWYPVYEPGSCPYVDEAFDCQMNGRPDSGYLHWRWKPDGCDLPRFNATDFLVRLRGKRLLLIGDSMNRNQFESMLCLLHQGLPDKSKMLEVHGYKITKGRGFYIFKFVDYNCTVEFVRSHFLVREGVRINGQGNSNPTLSIDRIDKSSGRWKRADILIFNTGHWWTHGKTSRGKNYFKEGDYVYPRFDAVEAYRRALKTWANWVDKSLNPARQMVFYRAYSSAHFRGGDWDSGGTCNGETEPILRGAFLDNYPTKMKIVEEVIQEMKVPVILLNITRLTNFRKDGHPSIYGKIRPNQTKVSTRRQDCSHWCLPGLPDAWNELVYATLVFQQTAVRQL